MWRKAWEIEDEDWNYRTQWFNSTIKVAKIMVNVNYLTWWHLADLKPNLVSTCEIMAKIVCNASYLKCDDVRLKLGQMSSRVCQLCDLYAIEDATHLILQCPYFDNIRRDMFVKLSQIDYGEVANPCDNPNTVLKALLGKVEKDALEKANIKFMTTAGKYICQMNNVVMKSRDGIG